MRTLVTIGALLTAVVGWGTASAHTVPTPNVRGPATVGPILIETCNIEDIRSQIVPGTLVVFEIENTVMETETQVGSEQWADAVQRYYAPPGANATEARAALAPIWNQVLMRAKMRAVNTGVQGFLRGLQRSGCPVLGLSAKDPDMAYVMLEHLRSVDIDFSRSAPNGGHVDVLGVAHPAKLVHGVLFAGMRNDLGDVLEKLLRQLDLPNKVIVISHKQENLKRALEMLSRHHIPLLGVRLGCADARVAHFRPEVAEVQLNFIGRPLTNEAAAALIPRQGWFFWQ